MNNGQAIMLWSFGTYGNPGFRYFFFTPARWDKNVASRISIGDAEPWANEDGINETLDIADASLHHYVITIDGARNMTLYVDGVFALVDELNETHTLAAVDATDAFIGRSVYSADPTWKGTVELYSIWDAALTEEEVFQNGEYINLKPGVYIVKSDNYTQKIVIK